MADAEPVPPTWSLLLRELDGGDPDRSWDRFVAFVDAHYGGTLGDLDVHATPRSVHRTVLALAVALSQEQGDWAPGLREPLDRLRAALDRVVTFFEARRAHVPAIEQVLGVLRGLSLRSKLELTALPVLLASLSMLIPLGMVTLSQEEQATLDVIDAELREAVGAVNVAAGEQVLQDLTLLRGRA